MHTSDQLHWVSLVQWIVLNRALSLKWLWYLLNGKLFAILDFLNSLYTGASLALALELSSLLMSKSYDDLNHPRLSA